MPVVGVNVASIPAGLSTAEVAAIDGSNANNRVWNGGIAAVHGSFYPQHRMSSLAKLKIIQLLLEVQVTKVRNFVMKGGHLTRTNLPGLHVPLLIPDR